MINNETISWIRELTIPEREKGVTRTFYSYPAKFLSKLPRGLIQKFTQIGELVLDPFVGGGTTGLEAMLLNRRFIGYDINPFGIFISRVKTTFIEIDRLEKCLKLIISESKTNNKPNIEVLDDDDRICLGTNISFEINSLIKNIKLLRDSNEEIENFFLLAIIHTVKIIGRRDFETRNNKKNSSITPMFVNKARRMIRGLECLPRDYKYIPKFFLDSNHNLNIPDSFVDLIVTSPPYKDKYIEYQQIQIQRRTLKRSKRSSIIQEILKTKPVSRKDLCWTGKKGQQYWINNKRSLKECIRVLKPNKLAFFWTGFKTLKDYKIYKSQINEVGFNLIDVIKVQLSNDRSASGRSTYHGRETGMMTNDFLFITQK